MHTPPERYGVFVMTTSTNVVNGAAAAQHLAEGESAPTVLTTVQDLLAEVLGRLASSLAGAAPTININVRIGKVQLGAAPAPEAPPAPPDDTVSNDALRYLAEGEGKRLTLAQLLDRFREDGKEVNERTLQRRLARLITLRQIDNKQAGGVKGYGLTRTGELAATPPGQPRTMVQRDVLLTLQEAGKRLTMDQLAGAMEKASRCWSDDTLRKALAEMTGTGLLDNQRCDANGQSGYAPVDE